MTGYITTLERPGPAGASGAGVGGQAKRSRERSEPRLDASA